MASVLEYIPNVLQVTRAVLAAGGAAFCAGIGWKEGAQWCREKERNARVEMEETRAANAAVRKDVSIASTQGELARKRTYSEETREKGYATRTSGDLEHQGRLKSEKSHTERTAKILGESKEILKDTVANQQQVKATQTDVHALQRESNQLRNEIAKEALAAAKEYRQTVSQAQLTERQTAGVQGKTTVEGAQHHLALQIIDKQVQLAVEMAKYKHELKSANLDQKQELNKKIADCEARQELYIAKVSSELKADELTQLSGFMKGKMQAAHFETTQAQRAEASTAMKGSIDKGVQHADVARTAETGIVTAVAGNSAKEQQATDRITQVLTVAEKANDPSVKQLLAALPDQLAAAAAAKQTATPLAAEQADAHKGPTPLRTHLNRSGGG